MAKTREVPTPSDLVEGLARLGFLRDSCFPEAVSADELQAVATRTTGGHVRRVCEGWLVVESDETLAVRALRRIAGAVEEMALGVVPLDDVVEGLWKMASFGPYDLSDVAERRKIGRNWAGSFDARLPRTVVAALCAFVGVSCDLERGLADFSGCRSPIPMDEDESDVMSTMDRSLFRALTCGYIVHLSGIRRCRTTTLTLLEGIPFVLKGMPRNREYRMIGSEGTPDAYVETVKAFQGAVRSQDGHRLMLEWKLSYETVAANSFNIGDTCRESLHGKFVDVSSGLTLSYDKNGTDARKVTGVAPVVRKMFPDFLPKESLFVVFDMESCEARAEVVSIHATERRHAMSAMLECGIWHGPLIVEPAMAA